MTATFIYTILFISSMALKTGPLSLSTHLGLVYLSYRHVLASCNFFRSNNFLASLAFIQAHSIYLIMASFLYTEQILFVRLPIGFGDRPVKSFYSFRTRYRPIVGVELLILLFYSLI